MNIVRLVQGVVKEADGGKKIENKRWVSIYLKHNISEYLRWIIHSISKYLRSAERANEISMAYMNDL